MSNSKRIQLLLALMLMMLLTFYLPMQSWLAEVHDWSQVNPNLAVFAFLVLIVVGMVLLVPVSIQAMAARFSSGLGTGFLVMWLARLPMILPYNLPNYSLGLTAVRLRDYLMGSAIGMLPGIFLFVFIGITVTDIAAIVSGELEFGDYDLLIGIFCLLSISRATASSACKTP